MSDSAQPRTLLWHAGSATHAAILAHPFLAGLADGSLPRTTFRHYIAQDSLYLRDFARSLERLGERSGRAEIAALFRRHSAGAIEVERALHASFEHAWRDLPAEPPAETGPTTLLYTSWLLRCAHELPFLPALAAHLPCYWIYQQVGRALLAKGSPDPLYARWIATYGGPEFDAVVEEVLALFDSLWPHAPASERDLCLANYATAARLEWRFWDAAWRRERWNPV